MSKANVNYVIEHNPEVNPNIVEVCPNSTDIIDNRVDENTRRQIREKYDIPLDKKVFVYGGNLGRPQGISFLIECLKRCESIKEAYFLIAGDGTEYYLLQEYIESKTPKNVKLMKRLPKSDYDTMVGACDIGLIFLDHRFTIPNFPSRMISYMLARIPILAVTDPNTDIGKVITNGGFGWWCESDDSSRFVETIRAVLDTKEGEIAKMKEMEFKYLEENYSSDGSYKTILRHFI